MTELPRLSHLQAAGLDALAPLPPDDFYKAAAGRLKAGGRAVSYFGFPEEGRSAPLENGSAGTRLVMILAFDAERRLEVLSMSAGDSFRALTPDFPQLHLFEREIAEQTGLRCDGHPWLKPVRYPLKAGSPIPPGTADFFRVHGAEVHEVAVGPVHAGVIEPGHFRFQCHGEQVFHLEIALGYQHRGIERRLIGGPGQLTSHYLETLAGDTTIGHASAYCRAVESLSGTPVPARGEFLRALMLELERLANHTGDLGALAGDVAYLPTASFCGRLRGDFLNMSALICGNRFGRGMIIPGGTAFDLDHALIKELRLRLDAAFGDVENAADLLWGSSSVMERFEGTGIVSRETALALGLTGPAARASGVRRDVRRDFPAGAYLNLKAPLPEDAPESGDVRARAYTRWLEIKHSYELINGLLDSLPSGPVFAEPGAMKPESFTVSLEEGWRGEICHTAITDKAGKFRSYKIKDPSFNNWQGLAMALRGAQISDFPLCNKSFNLSYCGHDL
ncbi:MAG: hydrogenase [Elusimicrobia bacterium GWA2_56_46]|nr:MAG: hydrogenase [Elusimicrobia bacterium GWA2_56_46]OGR55987.1 MAG: hydrogenase [Elusimicrobia bacterium GWC2_56_31]HBB65931.1 hydrogenase [Elusimicrobiota bacterium]HBW22371.1 hydrogenase [Elusimicrobiota bacterium]